MRAWPDPIQPLNRCAAARATGGGPGDRPSEQHRQIDRQLTERLEHHRVFELADIGIAGSAECYGADVARSLRQDFRLQDRGRCVGAFDSFARCCRRRRGGKAARRNR